MTICTTSRVAHTLQTRFHTGARWLCIFLMGLSLAACEAPLDLSGVNAQLAQSVQRADLFQAAERYEDTVIAVGSMGTIVQSPDLGNSWQRTTLPGKPFLVDVTACPDGRFFALEKTDGIWSAQPDGSWTRQALPELTEAQALTCNANNVLWVTGGFSTIIHSDDAGASWESWTIDEDLYLTTIQFIDQQHAVVTGEFGTVLLSADNGLSWNRADDLPESFYPQSTYFTSPDDGWVVGLSGTIWNTETGGQSWQAVQSGTPIPLYGIEGFEDTLLAVGDNTTILYYRAGDDSWTPLSDTKKSLTYLRAVTGLGDGQFLVAGGGTLYTVTVPGTGAQENDTGANPGTSDE